MKLNELRPAPGSTKARVRKGRGEGSGKGKSAGRGTKGTGARGRMPAGFEGGQMPLQRRLPKLPGFTPRNRVPYAPVNLDALERAFDDGATVSPETLAEAGLVRRNAPRVKILASGELTKRLDVHAHAFSAAATAAISEAGGTTTVLER